MFVSYYRRLTPQLRTGWVTTRWASSSYLWDKVGLNLWFLTMLWRAPWAPPGDSWGLWGRWGAESGSSPHVIGGGGLHFIYFPWDLLLRFFLGKITQYNPIQPNLTQHNIHWSGWFLQVFQIWNNYFIEQNYHFPCSVFVLGNTF